MNNLRKVVIVGSSKDHVNQISVLREYYEPNIENPGDIILVELGPTAHARIAQMGPDCVAVIVDRINDPKVGEFLTLLSADPKTAQIPLKMYHSPKLLHGDPELAEVGSHMILDDVSLDAAASIIGFHNRHAHDRIVN